MNTPNSLRIACKHLDSLGERITKAPFHVIYSSNELSAHNYQPEGVIVPDLSKRKPLSYAELNRLAAHPDTPDALRLVKVPQRTDDFMQALSRSGKLFESSVGSIINFGKTSLAQAEPGKLCTSINPETGKYVGLHIDALTPGDDRYQMMMGIACSKGDRGLTFCPDITTDVISKELQYAQRPTDRLARREQIRQAVKKLGATVCYTLWVKGSGQDTETYEAYANFQPHNMLHDGTSYFSQVPAAIQLLNTGSISSASFESVI